MKITENQWTLLLVECGITQVQYISTMDTSPSDPTFYKLPLDVEFSSVESIAAPSCFGMSSVSIIFPSFGTRQGIPFTIYQTNKKYKNLQHMIRKP